MSAPYVCPPEHPHEAMSTCYAHGCRCAPCKARRAADSKRWQAAAAERAPKTPRVAKAPAKCGTLAGYQQHRRAGTPPCDLCRAYNTGYQQGRRRHREAARPAPLAPLRLAPAIARDVLAAIGQRAELLDETARARGVEAPVWRIRAERLRAAGRLIHQQIGDPK